MGGLPALVELTSTIRHAEPPGTHKGSKLSRVPSALSWPPEKRYNLGHERDLSSD
jgi:hypothetical protein